MAVVRLPEAMPRALPNMVLCVSLAALSVVVGCKQSNDTGTRVREEGIELKEKTDLISWRPFTGGSLRESAQSGNWVLIDSSEFAIIPTQRGGKDYRFSTAVADLIRETGTECYRYAGGAVDESEDGFGAVLNELVEGIEVPNDIRGGVLINFRTKHCIAMRRGTEDELVRILDRIKLMQSGVQDK